MRIHSFTPSTYVNGPGKRAMIHFQGCTLKCPGCFNTNTHSNDQGKEMSLDEVLSLLPSDIDGVTISGGEPFLQPSSLLQLVQALRQMCLSIVVFTGFYREEILKINYGPHILDFIDVLIDGRFNEAKKETTGLRGSSNQTIHILTKRHLAEEFEERNIEVTINAEGSLTMTGFPSTDLLREMRLMGMRSEIKQ
ncbi:4Fe-4S single cluster domain-containing protein [Paenibacillus polymyxa]|uniref:4Fe-4S single cluster domain-containing protein n=1 Tax=Paenibacillus polymyxa TaxID=1406 RepID=UPI0025B68468|nr:4Fe-4S single cluster domain-containing protein [Paenibacillus polymyxa]MDN4106694.1 4Fe-4S single cluster domain-containing protein [Paenibacillus polymyxa]